jgi:hypothetical protein
MGGNEKPSRVRLVELGLAAVSWICVVEIGNAGIGAVVGIEPALLLPQPQLLLQPKLDLVVGCGRR